MVSPQTDRAAPRTWIAAFAATLLAMMTLQTASLGFSPLLPAIQHQFHMSYSQLGLFTGAYGLLAIAISVPAGLLVKRIGEKPVVAGGLLIVAAGLTFLALSVSFATSFAGRIIWIGGYRFAFVAVLAALAKTCPPSLRGRTMGILGALSSLASVFGAPFGSRLSAHYGWRGGIAGFVGLALLGLLVFAIFYRSADVLRPGSLHEPFPSSAPTQTRSAFLVPRVWALALFSGLVGMPAFGATFFGPAAGRANFHLDAVATAWMISLGYLLACLLNISVGFLVDHFNRWFVLTGVVACAVPAALLMNSHQVDTFRIAAAVVIAISFTAVNQSYGLASDVLRGQQVGNVMGILSLGAGITGYLGPQLLGVLRDRTGSFEAGWRTIAAIAALTCLELIALGWTASRPARQAVAPLEASEIVPID